MCSRSTPRAKDSLRIILISTLSADIVLVIHMFDILPRMMLCLLLVNVIQALGLEELVDLSASEADEEFLGELVGNGLSCLQSYQLIYAPTQSLKARKDRQMKVKVKWGDEPS